MGQQKSPTNWQGRVQIYTGDGKGKTTAALGLALRAAGAGLKVVIIQFAKSGGTSEAQALKRFDDLIAIRSYGSGCFVNGKPSEEDRRLAREALADAQSVAASGECRVLILDEANIACHYGLITVDELLALADSRPGDMELVITGRRAHPRLMERADLVAEMREVKHYYAQGVKARKGIES
jgi:cob(I)alamin adenosyltransferase